MDYFNKLEKYVNTAKTIKALKFIKKRAISYAKKENQQYTFNIEKTTQIQENLNSLLAKIEAKMKSF